MTESLAPRCAALLAACALLPQVPAQTPRQLLDIRPAQNNASSSPVELTRVGATVFFAAHGDAGPELYRTLGGAGQAVRVADIRPGARGSDPGSLTARGADLFFVADDGVSGRELWISDGTAAGTGLVLDLEPGPVGSQPVELTPFDGDLFFVAVLNQQRVLVRTDGTAAGTAPVAGAPATAQVGSAGGSLYFAGSDGVDFGLWSIDTAGTLQELRAFPRPPGSFTDVAGQLFFIVDDGVVGVEVWTSDGTAAGTQLVADVNPGAAGSSPSSLVAVGAELFFNARTAAAGFELWKSDGTAAGTVMVADLEPGRASSFPDELTAFAGKVVFRASVARAIGLWISDGTAAGTVALVTGVNPGAFHATATDVFFRGVDARGAELWATDGTAAGTRLVKELSPGPQSAVPDGFVTDLSNRRVLFGANDPVHGRELFASDGTAAGTVLLDDINTASPVASSSSNPGEFTAVFGGAVFVADDGVHGAELWRTDGSTVGTRLLLDQVPGPTGAGPAGLVRVGTQVLYAAFDAAAGIELWRTDGTAAGTRLLRDIRPGTESGQPSFLRSLGGHAWFSADDGVTGVELWRSDGTAAGTRQVADLEPAGSSHPREFVQLGNAVLFVASTLANGTELWRTDGTAAGTGIVAEVLPGPSSGVIGNLTLAGDKLFFIARVVRSGFLIDDLWVTDGTGAGTLEVARGVFGIVAAAGDELLFSATTPATGVELYATDGTPAGTRFLLDIEPGAGSSLPSLGIEHQGDAYFRARESSTGFELWRSDGTAAGTGLIADVAAGPASSLPLGLQSVGSRFVYFAASDAGGLGVWRTDGTAAGTTRIGAPFVTLAGSTRPRSGFTLASGQLLFAAHDGNTGVEPWVLDPGATAQPWPVACPLGARPALQIEDPVLGSGAALTLSAVSPGAAAVVLVSAATQPVALPGGCGLIVDAFSALPVVQGIAGPSGTLGVLLPIPAAPILTGLTLAAQGASLDSGGTLAVADGVYLTLGR